MNHSDRVLRSRLGAYAQHAKHDPRDTTAKARATFAASFATEVDPDGTLDPAERARRAKAALRAHMTRMALKSAQARRAAS